MRANWRLLVISMLAAIVLSVLIRPLSSANTGFETTSPKHSEVSVLTNDYQVGLSNQFILAIRFSGQYKFNDQYPARVKILGTPRLIKHSSHYGKDHFIKEGKYILIPITFTAIAQGREKVMVNIRYSVCSEQECALEDVDYSVELEIHE